MTSAAEAKLGALIIAAQKLVPLRQTLIEMGLPQPPSEVEKMPHKVFNWWAYYAP